MDESNSIVEAEYTNGTWFETDGQPKRARNVTSAAAKGSPIAAIRYTREDFEYRQLFFYDSDGLVGTVNSTGDGAWSKVYNLATDVI